MWDAAQGASGGARHSPTQVQAGAQGDPPFLVPVVLASLVSLLVKPQF